MEPCGDQPALPVGCLDGALEQPFAVLLRLSDPRRHPPRQRDLERREHQERDDPDRGEQPHQPSAPARDRARSQVLLVEHRRSVLGAEPQVHRGQIAEGALVGVLRLRQVGLPGRRRGGAERPAAPPARASTGGRSATGRPSTGSSPRRSTPSRARRRGRALGGARSGRGVRSRAGRRAQRPSSAPARRCPRPVSVASRRASRTASEVPRLRSASVPARATSATTARPESAKTATGRRIALRPRPHDGNDRCRARVQHASPARGPPRSWTNVALRPRLGSTHHGLTPEPTREGQPHAADHIHHSTHRLSALAVAIAPAASAKGGGTQRTITLKGSVSFPTPRARPSPRSTATSASSRSTSSTFGRWPESAST